MCLTLTSLLKAADFPFTPFDPTLNRLCPRLRLADLAPDSTSPPSLRLVTTTTTTTLSLVDADLDRDQIVVI